MCMPVIMVMVMPMVMPMHMIVPQDLHLNQVENQAHD